MFQTKLSKKSIRARINKIEEQLVKVKESLEVRLMLEYEFLPVLEKIAIREQWDAYYQAVKGTRAFQIYKEIGEATRNQDMGAIALLAAEAQELIGKRHELETPAYIDPASFNQGDCEIYHFLNKRKTSLLAELAAFGDKQDPLSEIKQAFW